MARKSKKELNELCKKFGVDTLWSFSRYDSFKTDRFEYYLKYILHKEEDLPPSIYGVEGGMVHDILEKYYNGEISYDEMALSYEDELFTLNCSELKYNRGDSEKNESIANKYESCIRHFFKNHQPVTFPHQTEKFITIKINDNVYCQGYIDFLFLPDKEHVRIIDYKTSTKYAGSAILAHGKQLILYAEGIRQLTGLPLENISCAWNFLKYVTVSYEQKNGKWKDRIVERHIIGESLVNTVKMWLKEFGYENEIDDYVDRMVLENDLSSLPDEVKAKFKITDCYVDVPLTEEIIEDLKNDIAITVDEINKMTDEYNKTNDEKIFWQEVTDSDTYRLACLSGYSRSLHRPYNEYLKNKEMFESKREDNNNSTDEDDLLAFVNSL